MFNLVNELGKCTQKDWKVTIIRVFFFELCHFCEDNKGTTSDETRE